ncbi:MAG: hypothetical protein CMO63_05015 [Verrucomicrobiales bacterium]|nr:hypothetical protein [Verrucomicrobiales bacterium]
MPRLELLAPAILAFIFIFVGIVDVEDDEVGLVVQGLCECQVCASCAMAADSEVITFSANAHFIQFMCDFSRVGAFDAGTPNDGITDYKYAGYSFFRFEAHGLWPEATSPSSLEM